jgi:hypothetical protein
LFASAIARSVELNPQGEIVMKRLISSIILAIILLTSGAVVTPPSMVGTAYANGAGD